MIETFAALAEPNRFRIVELLRSGPRPVNDIGERLKLNQPQVSKHLRVLKKAGPRRRAAARPAAALRAARRSRCASSTTGSSATASSGMRASTNWTSSSRSSRRRRSPMAARSEVSAAVKNRTSIERLGRSRARHRPHLQRAGAHRVRRLDAGRAGEALVGAQSLGVSIVSCDADVRVGGRYRYVLQPRQGRARSPSRARTPRSRRTRAWSTPVLRAEAVPRTRDADAVIVTVTFEEQRRQDAPRARAVSVKGSARRRHRLRHGARHARDDGPARRALVASATTA